MQHEIQEGMVSVKNMITGEQTKIKKEKAI
jgi:histidyl-tRNA synthetase